MLTPLSPASNIEGHDICKSNATVPADALEWNLAVVQQSHEIRS